MNTETMRPKPKPQKKRRSPFDVAQVLDDLEAFLESSHALGKGNLEIPAEIRKAPHLGRE